MDPKKDLLDRIDEQIEFFTACRQLSYASFFEECKAEIERLRERELAVITAYGKLNSLNNAVAGFLGRTVPPEKTPEQTTDWLNSNRAKFQALLAREMLLQEVIGPVDEGEDEYIRSLINEQASKDCKPLEDRNGRED